MWQHAIALLGKAQLSAYPFQCGASRRAQCRGIGVFEIGDDRLPADWPSRDWRFDDIVIGELLQIDANFSAPRCNEWFCPQSVGGDAANQ